MENKLADIISKKAYERMQPVLKKIQEYDPDGYQDISTLFEYVKGRLSDEYFSLIDYLWNYFIEELTEEDFFALKYQSLFIEALASGEMAGKELLNGLSKADEIYSSRGAKVALEFLKSLKR